MLPARTTLAYDAVPAAKVEINLSIITINDIIVNEGRREINAASVKKLAQSIDQVGLRHPITVRKKGDRYILVAGLHRIEAHKNLGLDHIPATIVTMTDDDAQLWEIAENLHRAELSKLERDDNIAEWIRITERQSSQVATNESKRSDGRGHRAESGVNAAARELGVDKDDAHRAVKVASLSDEAKDAAREHHLDNNRSAMLAAASKPTVAEQVAVINERHTAKVENYNPNHYKRLKKLKSSEVSQAMVRRLSERIEGLLEENRRLKSLPVSKPSPGLGFDAICGRVKDAIIVLSGLPPAAKVAEHFRSTDFTIMIDDRHALAAAWLSEFSAAYEEFADAIPSMVGAD
jgi:ParB/RepB/Spo0J family partition protein